MRMRASSLSVSMPRLNTSSSSSDGRQLHPVEHDRHQDAAEPAPDSTMKANTLKSRRQAALLQRLSTRMPASLSACMLSSSSSSVATSRHCSSSSGTGPPSFW
jgi:hypothetical protein